MNRALQPSSPIILTMGDPAGIGSEIALRAWHETRRAASPFVLLTDPGLAIDTARLIGLETPFHEVRDVRDAATVFDSALPILPLSQNVFGRPGKPDERDAGAVVEAIDRATRSCLDGLARGMVTNPIHKKSLYKAGFSFPGHTEYVADLCGVSGPVMMLASPVLRVVPVTIHLPLRAAIDALTSDEIVRVGRTVFEALKNDFGITTPRIAISGLNPHAGEEGALGHEDRDVIEPAVETLIRAGIDVVGPVPGDALFTPDRRATYDAAICMYHDQALIPIKALDFDRAVNITLGLPIVRTSPDHGTAFDIAGQGKAKPDSLIAALAAANDIAVHRSGSPRAHDD